MARLRLGSSLRKLRTEAELTLEDVGRELECSLSKISRLEVGKGIPRWRDIRDMLDLYGLPEGEERDRLLAWALDGKARPWWGDFADVLGNGLSTYIELEWDAARLEAFEPSLVHALLQTRDYATVLLNLLESSRSSMEIERLVDVRMTRQKTLAPDHGLDLRCILDESALHRVVGSPEVQHHQLEHLLELTTAEHVDVRVLPFSAGPVELITGSFTRLEFGEEIDRDLVFLERTPNEELLTNPASVQFYAQKMMVLARSALGRLESQAMIAAAARALRDQRQ